MAVAALPDTLIDELVAICGEAHVFTGRSALFNRARVPSPFPHTDGRTSFRRRLSFPPRRQISEVVKLANRTASPSFRAPAGPDSPTGRCRFGTGSWSM
jgi:hypothetical protein